MLPAHGLANVVAIPDCARSRCFSLKHESLAPSTAGNSRLKECEMNFNFRSSQIHSAGNKSDNTIPIDWDPRVTLANSSEPPADGFAMDAVLPNFEKQSVKAAEPSASGDLRAEVDLKLRNGRVYSADDRLKGSMRVVQSTRTALTSSSRRKVRRTRSLGGSPSSKRKCCLQDWYGDKHRRRCEEHIPEVVQRYGRPANFVTSHFSSTLSETQGSTSSRSAPMKSVPTWRSLSSNFRNAVSNSTHSAPTSTYSVSTSRKVSHHIYTDRTM